MKIKVTEYTDNIIKAFNYEVELDLKSDNFLEEFKIRRAESLKKYLKITEGVKEYFKKRKEVVSMEESLRKMEEDNGGGLTDEQLAGGCYVTFPEGYDYVKEDAYMEVIKKAKDKEKAIKDLIDKIDDIECERLVKMTYEQWDEFQRQYPNGDRNRSELYGQIVDIIVARGMAEAGM